MYRLLQTHLAALVAGAVALSLVSGLKADDKPPPAPAKSADNPAAGITAKPLGDTVKKGLEYLIKQQHADGGWGQGGGWRVGGQGGRVEGAQVQDPPDVGNTCIAVLALVRSGS